MHWPSKHCVLHLSLSKYIRGCAVKSHKCFVAFKSHEEVVALNQKIWLFLLVIDLPNVPCINSACQSVTLVSWYLLLAGLIAIPFFYFGKLETTVLQ